MSADSRHPVFGKEYCSHDQPMELLMSTRSFHPEDTDITDSNGAIVFKIRKYPNRGFFSSRRVVMDAEGNSLASFKSKNSSSRHRFLVFKGDSKDMEDVMFSVRRSSFFQLKTKLDVFYASNKEEIACDFKIKMSFWGRSCTIYQGDTTNIIAEAKEETSFFKKSKHRIFIYPHVDYAFISILVAIVEQMMREEAAQASTSSASGAAASAAAC